MASKEGSKQIRLKVITPMRTVFDKLIDFVIMRPSVGDIGILSGHEPYSAILDYGALRIFIDGEEREEEMLMVMGGIVKARDNEVVVLSDLAERPDKLQQIIAQIEEERAANKLREKALDLDTHRAELAIRRALVHMDVSAYTILKANNVANEK